MLPRNVWLGSLGRRSVKGMMGSNAQSQQSCLLPVWQETWWWDPASDPNCTILPVQGEPGVILAISWSIFPRLPPSSSALSIVLAHLLTCLIDDSHNNLCKGISQIRLFCPPPPPIVSTFDFSPFPHNFLYIIK